MTVKCDLQILFEANCVKNTDNKKNAKHFESRSKDHLFQNDLNKH